ncbi:MAG TPA: EFR1 family ferrodoxin [Desulfitobacteriaceae bacterium]|jgi:NAD-dependent dihydropyrimidine dehydrogenase PreA subunit/flavodoxin|nr:EFR1 family ferrodoxin [Desulfitobacteriaceae bacterium]
MNTEIYYFSGTGNSLHVAKELAKRLPGSELIPIVSILDNDVIITRGEIVGFVFPVYFTTVPFPVRSFLKKLNPDSAKYIFSAATRSGTFSVANRNVRSILKKKGKRLDAQFVLNMAGNSPTGLKPGKGDENWVHRINKEKVSQLETELQSSLDLICKVILAQEKYPPKAIPNPFFAVLERVMYLLTRNMKTQINYYPDSTCTGCGLCEEVCPAQKIRMHEKKPVWRKDVNCYYCYACFNFCPAQSILVENKYTKKDGRYFHPDITAVDIAGQKRKFSGN